MSIFMSKFALDDYSAMQGPCPSGFHVPLNTEWQSVYDIWTTLGGGSSDGINFGIALKLPFAGYRNISSAGVSDQGSCGYYWSSSSYDADNVYLLFFSSTALLAQNTNYRTYGFSVRCFKDTPVTPDSSWTKLYGTSIESGGIFWSSTDGLISLSSNGTTWITISDKNLGATTVWNNGDALSQTNCGYYYQRGNNYGFAWTGSVTKSSTQVNASSYGPGNYYSSSTFITGSADWSSVQNDNLRGGVTGVVQTTGEPKKIYIRVEAQPITTSGIYHNSDLGLISLSSDGSNWTTISDKNLGATQVYNSGDTLSETNCGKYYQWGNNYGFPFTGDVTTSTTQIDASNYGPGNYYSNSTFIMPTATYPWNYSSIQNDNLWGDTTNTNEARQGPCPSGFHIPSYNDFYSLWTIMSGFNLTNGEQWRDKLFMPFMGGRNAVPTQPGTAINQGTNGSYWTSSPDSSGEYKRRTVASASVSTTQTECCTRAAGIRPFKNEVVIPDETRTVLYQPS